MTRCNSAAAKADTPPCARAAAGARNGPDEFRDVVPVLMAGGVGTRFWPLSSPARPKQFLTELTGRSLFAQAAARARLLVPWDRVLVMTNAAFIDHVGEQAPEIPRENVILEPLRCDTAAAVILAALWAERRWPGSVLAVFPSDHFIDSAAAFRQTMAPAVARARQGGLGTIGIRPTHAATAFGYLRLAEPARPLRVQRVEQFVEKPDRPKAEQYLASGRHLWNSGIFVWRADALLSAAARHLPETRRLLAGLAESFGAPDFAERAAEVFRRLTPVSIDYAVMEKAEDIWCVPAAFDWNDIGTWQATEPMIPPDERGNRVRGPVLLDDVSGTLVIGNPGHPIVVVGLSDCMIVQGPAGTLICHRSAAERLKPILARLLETPGDG